MKQSKSLRAVLGFFVPAVSLLSLAVTQSVSQTTDPCDTPNGTFPVVGENQHEDCVGYHNVSVDPVTGEYFWDSHGAPGSFCYNQLRNNNAQSTSGSSTSACWLVDANGGIGFVPPYGFRSSFTAWAQPGLGDFLSPSPTLAGSAVCLVPSAAADQSVWWNDATRQTLNQSVDLVTGMPLAQVTHLELPFDGATFRLTRTRSGHREDQRQMGTYDEYFNDEMSAMDRWWDWDGEGWMISESPLLVFDSAVPDIVGNNPRMSWLVLDAHHSIPFQQIESTGIYAAPPRFNARMSHNGEWGVDGNGNRGWLTRPTQVDIYLYDGALHYTFVIIQDDIPEHIWNKTQAFGQDVDIQESLNSRPYLTDQFKAAGEDDKYSSWDPLDPCINPGLGLPYIGLCVEIKDQYNHIVEVNYSGIDSKPVDFTDPSTSAGGANEGDTDGSSCVECGQACARKGLIRSVKLKTQTPTGTETRWSLIYAYRGFDDHPSNMYSGFFNGESFRERDLFGAYQIDRIYVYEVTEDDPDPEQSIIAAYKTATGTTHDTFVLALSQDEVTELDGTGPDPLSILMGSSLGIADQWTHLVQNHFIGVDDDVTATADGMVDWVWNGAVKVMTTVTSRITEDQTPSSSNVQTEKHWVYHYEGDVIPGQDAQAYPKQRDPVLGMQSRDRASDSSRLHWLRRIYEPQDVARALISSELGFSTPLTLEDIVYMLDASGDSLASSDEATELMASYATRRFEPSLVRDGVWETGSNGYYNPREWTPEPQLLFQNGYIVNDLTRIVTDEGNRTAGRVVVPGADGQNHYYQILRLYYAPIETEGTTGLGDEDYFVYDPAYIDYDGNQRSAFVHPYQWHGYSPPTGNDEGWPYDNVTAESPDLTQVRWITIIDEFANPADLYPEVYDEDGYGVYEGQFGIKKSQLSRRVVELSPSGYLLRDRKWEFRDGIAEQSGGGLGEQYVYQTVEDYFEGTPVALPPAPTQDTDEIGEHRETDELAVIRNELLSVEYRSIGWSAAELSWNDVNQTGIDPTENGYTRFTKYDVFLPAGETWLDYADDPNTTDVNELELSELRIPLQSRIQETATGFRRGSSFMGSHYGVGWTTSDNQNPKLYTSQSLRNPDRPSELIANIQFVTSAEEANLLDALPAFDPNDPHPDADMGGSDAEYQFQRVVIERREPTNNDGSPIPQSELPPETEWPVLSRMIIGVPHQVYPDSPWYYPVEREFYDNSGNPTWSCTGQLKNPLAPDFNTTDSYEVLTFNYFVRDREGRSLHTVLDASSGSSLSPADPHQTTDFVVDPWPATEDGTSWQRIGINPDLSPTPALNYVTSFVYDRYAPGLCDAYYPNGRRWARRVITLTEPSELGGEAEEYAREYVFNNLQVVDGEWVTESEGQVKDYRGTDVFQSAIVTRNVVFNSATIPNNSAGNAPLSFGSSNQPLWYVKSAIQVGVDGNGRIQKATLLERAPDGALLAVGTKEVNDLGELYREQVIDRTITVETRNSLGQTLRVYQGTEDRRWYLPTADQHTVPDPDMILLQRTEYGGGVNDAWQPTVIRQYKSTPLWAYNDLHGQPPTNDTDGIATVMHYDWQGRVVRTDSYERGDHTSGAARRLGTTLIYYDFLDRPYLEVVYGEDPQDGSGPLLSIPAGIDPVTYVDAELFPQIDPNDPDRADEFDIGQLFLDLAGDGSLLRPKSITQSVYSLNGGLEERRVFDTSWSGSGEVTYLANFMYQGRGGTEVFSQSPGGSIEVTLLDSVGRVKSVAQMAPTVFEYTTSNTPEGLKELARTDYLYDADGNVVETKSWERVVDDSNDTLALINAVRTRTLNWYDVHKRLIATAEIGTEQSGYMAGPESYVHGFPAPGDDFSNFPAPYWDEQTKSVVLPATFPTDALVRVYGYDDSGNKVYSIDPEGVQTKYEYTATNRLAFKTENAAASWEDQRMSGYVYQYGRLVEMNLVTEDPLNTPAPLAPLASGDVTVTPGYSHVDAESYPYTVGHRTDLEYGADIVILNTAGDEYIGVSRHNGLIGKMSLPNEQTGDPADDADVFLRYTFQGQVAERFSGNGEAFRYIYDDLGRLISVETGTWDPAYPPNFVDIDPQQLIVGGETPTDVIRLVEYTYDERGNVTDVVAWSDSTANRQQIAHTRMAYDDRDRLVNEWQLHGDGVIDAVKTPHMSYSWEYEATNLGETGGGTARTGHDRMTSMTYPVPDVSVTPRVITIGYGVDASESDLLSRLTEYDSSIGTLHLADFEYSGGGRRTGLALKNNKIYSESDYDLQGGIGLNGFDQFGRKTETRYMGNRAVDDEVLYRANYALDKVGNRISTLVKQAPVGGVTQDNLRSTLNTYDRLHRLVGTQVGTLTFDSQSGAVNGISSIVHTDNWTLDALGNWAGEFDENTGDVVNYGRHTFGSIDSYGVPWSLSTHDQYSSYDFGVNHTVNRRNAIEQLGFFEQVDTDPAIEDAIEPVYDGAGRTLFDGNYGYHYDAWGRVVQISEATPDYDGGGAQTGFTYGAMLKHFVYDGYGRLIRTTSPVPDSEGGESTESRSLSFYYDGARRVQEILNDESPTLEGAAMSGDSGTQNLAAGSTNENNPESSSTPMALEKGINPQPITRDIYREYVWGPGDMGPDELLLQTDEYDDEYWCLMDAGGDLVSMAIVDSSNHAWVVRQWTYDAYGAILSADHLGTAMETHVGHKGLFMDRLDVPMGYGDEESPRLVPYGHTVYQNRNRSYSPSLGRFLQMDPNMTAMALLSTTASHGRGMGAISIAFSMESMYGDGLNLYQYLRSNPWTNADPLGLSVDPFEMSDAIINEIMGARAGTLSSIGKDAAAKAVLAAHIASMLPIPGLGIAGDLALVVLGEISMGEAMAGLALGIIPGGKLGKMLAKSGFGKSVMQMGAAAWGVAKSLATKAGSAVLRGAGGLLKGVGSLAARAAEWVVDRKKQFFGCGCFTASTLVLTANGAVPIIDIEEGQEVLAASDDGLSIAYSSNQVATKIFLGEANLVQLYVSHNDGKSELINTTDEHPFHVADTGEWTRADQLDSGDCLSTITGKAKIIEVRYTTERMPVYNLSIPESPTYYVGEYGIWVHNARGCPLVVDKFHPDWKLKGAHVHVRNTEVSIRPSGTGYLAVKASPGFNPTPADLRAVQEMLTDRKFLEGLHTQAKKAYEHALNEQWSNALEYKNLIKDVEMLLK